MAESNAKINSEFKKDFMGIITVASGVNREYGKSGKQVDQYLKKLRDIIALFNKKYKNLSLKLDKTPEKLNLKTFIKEKTVRDVFTNAASKIPGLKSIGTSDNNMAPIENVDRFSKELDSVTDVLFISYRKPDSGATAISLKQSNGLIETGGDEEIVNESSPIFSLCAHYALKEEVEDIDLSEELTSFGFSESPPREKIKKFFSRFNPRLEE